MEEADALDVTMPDGFRPVARASGDRRPRVAVCIPARNEVQELPKLLDALERLGGYPAQIAVCLLLDGCTDGSDAVAAAFRARSRHAVHVQSIAGAASNAGRARHRAMLMGLDALGADGGLLLSTDADSVPAADWLATMTAALAAADLVAGRVVRSGDRPSQLQDRLEAYYDALFALRRRLDPVPWEADRTHHHAGGANLGIRADVYRALGGFAPLAGGEDARLVDDAARAGWRIRRDAACVVETSDRRDGRAGTGLALALRQLDASGAASIRVAHPDDAAWQYRMHALARRAHERGSFDDLAATLRLSLDHVRGVARDCRNGEAFAMCLVPEAPDGMRSVGLTVAEAALDRLTGARRAA